MRNIFLEKSYTLYVGEARPRTRRATRGERLEGLPCAFPKIGKKCPNLGRKCPDCGHLWVKILI